MTCMKCQDSADDIKGLNDDLDESEKKIRELQAKLTRKHRDWEEAAARPTIAEHSLGNQLVDSEQATANLRVTVMELEQRAELAEARLEYAMSQPFISMICKLDKHTTPVIREMVRGFDPRNRVVEIKGE